MRIGYLRSESGEQDTDRAMAALEGAGCDRVVFDSTARNRPESSQMFLAFLARMGSGDTLVVTHLGQLARTTVHLLERLADLVERGVHVETVSGELDTSDPAARRSIMTLWSFELRTRRSHNLSRQSRGGAASLGRPRRLAGEDIARAREMVQDERLSVAEVAGRLGVSRATLYRSLRRS